MSSPVDVDPVKASRPPRILLIEDDPVDARAVRRGLQQVNGQTVHLGNHAGPDARGQDIRAEWLDHAGIRTFISVMP